MTNKEFIKGMTTEELGDFLCGISGRCSVCELKEYCGYKYFAGWLIGLKLNIVEIFIMIFI